MLRGLAILLVVGHHFGYYAAWTRGGWMGVDLFFVLSGFLIAGLLFSEYNHTGSIDFGRFFIRRGFKIYPPYFAFLFLTLPIARHHLQWQDFTFMQSYFQSFWGHTWSLSVEEHFYVALPLLLMASSFFWPSNYFRWIPVLLPPVILLCLIMRARVAPDAYFIKVGAPTHLRFDALFAGVTLSWFYHFKPEIFRKFRWHWLPVATILVISWQFAFPIPPHVTHTLGYTATLLGFSLLLPWVMNTRILGYLKPLAGIGKYSYSIYLWHIPLNVLFHRFPSAHSALGFWLFLAASIVVGVIMSMFIEIPALALRDRYFPAPRHGECGRVSIRDQAGDLVNV